MMQDELMIRPITAADSAAVISLANEVHGDNYLNEESLAALLEAGIVGDINLSFLAEKGGELLGVRLTAAPGQWPIDDACTPSAWKVEPEKICYFKCAAVAERARGLGVGKRLLSASIEAAKQLGCEAGLAHIWMQSPNNSAFGYFSACGGELITTHARRWYQASIEDGYYCPVCDGTCYCKAGEMMLYFSSERL